MLATVAATDHCFAHIRRYDFARLCTDTRLCAKLLQESKRCETELSFALTAGLVWKLMLAHISRVIRIDPFVLDCTPEAPNLIANIRLQQMLACEKYTTKDQDGDNDKADTKHTPPVFHYPVCRSRRTIQARFQIEIFDALQRSEYGCPTTYRLSVRQYSHTVPNFQIGLRLMWNPTIHRGI